MQVACTTAGCGRFGTQSLRGKCGVIYPIYDKLIVDSRVTKVEEDCWCGGKLSASHPMGGFLVLVSQLGQ